jgi:hypothetical protein
MFDKKPPQKGGPIAWEPTVRSPLSAKIPQGRSPSFAKVFRWSLPDGQTALPSTVEIVGSFTKWQKIPLTRDRSNTAWSLTLDNIPAHQTHHYMLLVDGQPTQDKNCDGLAIPSNPQETHYTIQTPRGPRVFMLFAQTK